MRNSTFSKMAVIAVMIFTAGCGSNHGKAGSSVDIPPYSVDEGAYLAFRETKGTNAWWGKADTNMGYTRFGQYTDGGTLAGTRIEMGEEQFVMLKSRADISTKYMFEEGHLYSMQLLWHNYNEENPYNNAMKSAASMRGGNFTPLNSAYCDTYYFYKDADLVDAKAWIEALDKQSNQKSKFNAKDAGGVKTYKATIGKAVEYFGLDELKRDRFLSLYLDCGAVVQLHDKDMKTKDVIGKTIDCVTDANNTVLEYDIN